MKTRLKEIHMENEYQLRLMDMNHNEKMKEISVQLTQQTEDLKKNQQVGRPRIQNVF